VWSLSPAETEALLLSLKVAFWSVAASLPVAVGLAWVLSRLAFPGKSLLDAVVHLPLVLPPVVVGYFLLVLFGRRGPVGAFLDEHFGITFAFKWTGAALACAVMGLPLLVRAVRQSLDAVDRGLEDAAATLGASPPWVFASVSLPLAIYAFTQVPGGDAQALRLCILSIVLSLAALMASEFLLRRATVRAAGRDA
jgi:molybdate transport system permease protein